MIIKLVCALDCKEKLEITRHDSKSVSFKIINAKGTKQSECYVSGRSAGRLIQFFRRKLK